MAVHEPVAQQGFARKAEDVEDGAGKVGGLESHRTGRLRLVIITPLWSGPGTIRMADTITLNRFAQDAFKTKGLAR